MTPITYESANRRAEISGDTVHLYRLTGKVRRSKESVYPAVVIQDPRRRVAAARMWAQRGKISKAIH